jgi:hypothetical protein
LTRDGCPFYDTKGIGLQISGDAILKKLLTDALIMGTQFACAGSKLRRILTGSASSAAIEVIVRFTYPPTKRDLKLLGSYGQVKNIWIS